MRLIFILALVLNHVFAIAQDSIPVYKRFPTVPPFSLVQYPDSTRIVKDDLENKKGTIIFNFSPDCDHCHEATKNLLAHIEKLKKVQIIMVTALDFKYIRPFYDSFNLKQYPNIIVARDPSYFLGTYYSVKNFPSIYIYDKKGKLIDEAIGHADFNKIAERF